jgi:trk system potassium uptake protein TrkA
LLDRLRLDDINSIEEIRVPESFVGQSLRDLNLRKNFNISVLAVGPDNNLTVNPPASHVIEAGEMLVVMGSSDHLAQLPGR